jgi:hypothetical protein
MKQLKLTTVIATFALGASAMASAATVQVDWQDPTKFRDVRATNESQEGFRERVMKELTEAFESGVSNLPEGQTLHVAVTDVDLAGEVEFFHDNYPFGLRVMRRVDAPSLSLQYELRDANDAVLKSGQETLRDRNYIRRPSALPAERSPLKYEKDMIKTWMRDTLQVQ